MLRDESASEDLARSCRIDKEKPSCGGMQEGFRGADGNRNHDLFDANEALYQLSYSPVSGDCSSRQLTKV